MNEPDRKWYSVRVEFDTYAKDFKKTTQPMIRRGVKDGDDMILSFYDDTGCYHAYNWNLIHSYHYKTNDGNASLEKT